MVILKKKVPGLPAGVLERFVLRARKVSGLKGTLNVLVTGSSALQSLNRQYRGKNKPTDVLSFPSDVAAAGRNPLAGEIAISLDIAAQNARKMGHSTAEEVKILVLHGVLHLAGYDHESDNGEMARKEQDLRRKLRLPSGLIERAAHSGQSLKAGRSRSKG